jgi:hypothetical protein
LAEDPGRLKRSDRRRSHMEGPADEDPEERRRRREERRARRATETPRVSRHTSAPVDSYFDPRNGTKSRGAEPEFLPADGPVYKDSSRRKKAGWPHSGTDSWVNDHSDAPPPPEDAPNVDAPADENAADESERRRLRKTRRHSRMDAAAEEDPEERRRRREARRQSRQDRDTMKSSEGSQENGRRSSRRDSGFVESRAPSAQGGLFSRWKNLI